MGPANNDVANAISTMATKIRWSITPAARPIPARIIPVALRAFSPNHDASDGATYLKRPI
jgi:hypothetical protein